MSDLHTDKVMQQGDADAKQPRPAFGWRAALISVLLLVIGAAISYFQSSPRRIHTAQATDHSLTSSSSR
jgi:hypothetical protein